MSKFNEKSDQNLVIEIARELSELTGETPSRLFTWSKQHEWLHPLIGSRQTFYTRLSERWKRRSEATSTENCRFGSYPFSCQLRLRAVSLLCQFSRDVREKKQRQVIILFGYEICSQLIHFRVYRGPDEEETLGAAICEMLPVATVTNFVEECARMVGLPLQKVLFTQRLIDFPAISGNENSYLSLKQGAVVLRKKGEQAGDNEVLCGFAEGSKEIANYITHQGNHPFVSWCKTTNATALTEDLSKMIKRHNNSNALKRLTKARMVFEARIEEAYAPIKKQRELSKWKVSLTPYLERMLNHKYAFEPFTLHEVRFWKRKYENYCSCPGDGSAGTATQRHSGEAP